MSNNYGVWVERTLNQLQIDDISELEGMTLSKFIQKHSNEIIEEIFVLEMNKRGYLYPADDDVFIRDIQISTRLRNILSRNGIFLVSQIGNYLKETYLKMRNIGEESYKELNEICEQYKIEIPTLEVLKKDLLPVIFSTRQLLMLYEKGIYLAKDIEDFSMEELQREYRYDKRLYNSICKVIEVKGLNVK